MFFCCDCCVLSGRGLCDELITRPEEFYRLQCVVVCDQETSRMRRPWPSVGPQRHRRGGGETIGIRTGPVFRVTKVADTSDKMWNISAVV